MHITRVTLRNVKSYGEETDIQFEQGVNLIKGENGAGKSTILEAIGYALFGSLPYPGKEFVRQGQKKGQIIVGFTGYDGREYEVIRGVGSDSTLKVRDPETNIVVSGSEDVLVRLRELLNVGLDTDLESMFEDVIGVPQGTMTAIFAETGRIRDPKFSKLLRLESYGTAYTELSKTDRHIRDLIEQNGREQATCDGQLTVLPVYEQDAASLLTAVNAGKAEQEATQTRLDLLTTALSRYAAAKQSLEVAYQVLGDCEQRLRWLKDGLKSAEADEGQSADAQQILEATQASYLAYQAAEQTLKQLDEQRGERDTLSQKLQNLEKELSAYAARIDILEQQLIDCHAAQEEFVILEPLARRQEELESTLQSTRNDQTVRNQLIQQIREGEQRCQSLLGAIGELDEKLARRQQLEAEVRLLQQQRADLNVRRDTLDAERQPIAHSLVEVQGQFTQEQKRQALYEQAQRDSLRCAGQITKQEEEVKHLRQSVEEYIRLSQQIISLESERITAQASETNAVSDRKSFEKQRESLRERHNLLGTADALCPVCQQPLNEHSRGSAASHYESEFERLRLSLSQTEQHEQAAVEDVKRIDLLLKSLRKQVGKLENEQALERALEKLEQLQRDQAEYDAAALELEDAPAAVEALETQERAIQEQLRQVDHVRLEVQNAQERLNEQIDTQQTTLNRLPQASERESKQQDYEDAHAVLQKAQGQIAQLADVDVRIEQLQSDIAALKNPRSRLLVAGQKASQLPRVEADHSAQVSKRTHKEAEKSLIVEQIKTFDGLDDAFAAAQQSKSSSIDGYRRYLRAEDSANLLDKRRIAREQAQSKVAEAETDYAQAEINYGVATKEYDAPAHQTASDEQSELNTRQASLKAEIGVKSEHLTSVRDKISQLMGIQSQLLALQQDAARLQSEQSAFHFVRQSIKDAGEKVRTRLVSSISQTATLIFGEIIGDYSPTLDWSSDYGISLKQGGATRSFRQLSGGEQMAAALSIRLALLTHLSQVRFVFLDEPTTNLDDMRRDSLASKLRTLRNVEQLFIISHDDTFGHDGVHQVEIAKVGGLSKVLS